MKVLLLEILMSEIYRNRLLNCKYFMGFWNVPCNTINFLGLVQKNWFSNRSRVDPEKSILKGSPREPRSLEFINDSRKKPNLISILPPSSCNKNQHKFNSQFHIITLFQTVDRAKRMIIRIQFSMFYWHSGQSYFFFLSPIQSQHTKKIYYLNKQNIFYGA